MSNKFKPKLRKIKKSLTKKNSTSFQKGRAKTGGRKKGTPNKRTVVAKVVRDNLADLVNGRLRINVTEDVLQKIYRDIIKLGLRNKDPRVQLSVALEILEYSQINKRPIYETHVVNLEAIRGKFNI